MKCVSHQPKGCHLRAGNCSSGDDGSWGGCRNLETADSVGCGGLTLKAQGRWFRASLAARSPRQPTETDASWLLHPTLQRRKLRPREAQSLAQDPAAKGVSRLPDTQSGLLATTPNCLRGYCHHHNRMLITVIISIIFEGSAPGRQIWVTASLGLSAWPGPRIGQRPVPAGPRTLLKMRGPVLQPGSRHGVSPTLHQILDAGSLSCPSAPGCIW